MCIFVGYEEKLRIDLHRFPVTLKMITNTGLFLFIFEINIFVFVYRRGLDVKSTSFLYAYFRDGTYLEYRKQTILGWDSLLGKRNFAESRARLPTTFLSLV